MTFNFESFSFKLEAERCSTGEGRLPNHLAAGGRKHAHLREGTDNVLNFTKSF
jgi:hypothetical protein